MVWSDLEPVSYCACAWGLSYMNHIGSFEYVLNARERLFGYDLCFILYDFSHIHSCSHNMWKTVDILLRYNGSSSLDSGAKVTCPSVHLTI